MSIHGEQVHIYGINSYGQQIYVLGYIRLNKNTDMMQQDADFTTADFLYMFRVLSAHHQEYKLLTRQPPVQVVMAAGCCHDSILYS